MIVADQHKFYEARTASSSGLSDCDHISDSVDGCDVKILKIACGDGHSVFLSTNGQVYGAGVIFSPHSEEKKASSASSLPTLTSASPAKPASVSLQNTAKVPLLLHFADLDDDDVIVDIASGRAHSLFLSSKGHVFSCGEGRSGQLGLGPNVVFAPHPQKISLSSVADPMKSFSSWRPRSIEAGGNHSIISSTYLSYRAMLDLYRTAVVPTIVDYYSKTSAQPFQNMTGEPNLGHFLPLIPEPVEARQKQWKAAINLIQDLAAGFFCMPNLPPTPSIGLSRCLGAAIQAFQHKFHSVDMKDANFLSSFQDVCPLFFSLMIAEDEQCFFDHNQELLHIRLEYYNIDSQLDTDRRKLTGDGPSSRLNQLKLYCQVLSDILHDCGCTVSNSLSSIPNSEHGVAATSFSKSDPTVSKHLPSVINFHYMAHFHSSASSTEAESAVEGFHVFQDKLADNQSHNHRGPVVDIGRLSRWASLQIQPSLLLPQEHEDHRSSQPVNDDVGYQSNRSYIPEALSSQSLKALQKKALHTYNSLQRTHVSNKLLTMSTQDQQRTPQSLLQDDFQYLTQQSLRRQEEKEMRKRKDILGSPCNGSENSPTHPIPSPSQPPISSSISRSKPDISSHSTLPTSNLDLTIAEDEAIFTKDELIFLDQLPFSETIMNGHDKKLGFVRQKSPVYSKPIATQFPDETVLHHNHWSETERGSTSSSTTVMDIQRQQKGRYTYQTLLQTTNQRFHSQSDPLVLQHSSFEKIFQEVFFEGIFQGESRQEVRTVLRRCEYLLWCCRFLKLVIIPLRNQSKDEKLLIQSLVNSHKVNMRKYPTEVALSMLNQVEMPKWTNTEFLSIIRKS